MSNLIKAYTYNTKFEAESAKQALAQQGIKSIISTTGTGVSILRLFNGPSELLVKKDDASRAKEILKTTKIHKPKTKKDQSKYNHGIKIAGRILVIVFIAIPFLIIFITGLISAIKNIFK